jgi:hypothetical protein
VVREAGWEKKRQLYGVTEYKVFLLLVRRQYTRHSGRQRHAAYFSVCFVFKNMPSHKLTLAIAWVCALVVFALVTLLPIRECNAELMDKTDADTMQEAVLRALPQLRGDCNQWQWVKQSYVSQLRSALESIESTPGLSYPQVFAVMDLLPTLGTGFDPQIGHDTSLGMPTYWGEHDTVYRYAWYWFWFRTVEDRPKTVLLCVSRMRIGNRHGGKWMYVLLAGYTLDGAEWKAPPLASFDSEQYTTPHTYENNEAMFSWDTDTGRMVYTDKLNGHTLTIDGIRREDLQNATANGRGACLREFCVGGAGSMYWSQQWTDITVQWDGSQPEKAIGWLDWQSISADTTIPLIRMQTSLRDYASRVFAYIWLAVYIDADGVQDFEPGWYMLYGIIRNAEFKVGMELPLQRLRYGQGREARTDSVVATVRGVVEKIAGDSNPSPPLPCTFAIGNATVETDDQTEMQAVRHDSGQADRWHIAAGSTWKVGQKRVGSGLVELNNFESADELLQRSQALLDSAQLPRVPRDAYPISHLLGVRTTAGLLALSGVALGVSLVRGGANKTATKTRKKK